MKKVLFSLAIALFAMAASYAKDVTTVEETVGENGETIKTTCTYDDRAIVAARPEEHWYLSVGIGTQFYMGDNDWRADFKDWWTFPSLQLYAGKWFTPTWGIHFGVSGYKMRGLYYLDNAYYKTDEFYLKRYSKNYYVQRGYNLAAYVMVDCNLLNLFQGYRPNRVYDLTAAFGGGYMIGWMSKMLVHSPTINLELNNQFNISKHFGMFLKLAANGIADQFDGEGTSITSAEEFEFSKNTPIDVQFGAYIGANFYFGSRDWKYATRENREVVRDNGANAAALAASAAALAAAEAETALLRERLEKSEAERLSHTVDKEYKVWYHVQFVINRAEVTTREKVNLSAIAGFIKSQPDRIFNLCGYADKQTATPTHNKELSERRVKAVYDVLVNEFGVNPSQLLTDDKGGVDLMFFEDNTLSRCVIISSE